MSPDTFDAIIVGSGAGGSAAAFKLARAGMRVLMLEKGTSLPADGSTLDIRRVVHAGEFLSREPWLDGRGRRVVPEEHFNVGGKTKWYGAALLRFAPEEFEPEPAHACAGWPIRYEELESYYLEAEALLGVRIIDCEPDLARIVARVAAPGRGWRAMPMPMGLSPGIAQHRDEAVHFDGFASVLGLKSEAEQSIVRSLRSMPGFRLETAAEVAHLEHALGEPQKITGVRLADGRRFFARRVLLAAGALHSPRILSRHLRASGLDAHLPGADLVGRNLKMHLLTAMVSVSASRMSDLIRKTTVLVHERFPHSSVQPLGFDGELIATLVPKTTPRFIARRIGARAYGFFLQTEDGSDPRNRVLEAGDGTASLPVLDYDANRLPQAAREHRAFTSSLQWALARAGFVSFTQRIGLQGTAHVCGTLMAGSDAAASVVDSTGRVHGMRGLYVVDGSVLPRSSRVNPSLSIYAWALRVGELLAREHVRTEPIEIRTTPPVEAAHAS
jgi:choline dehydrogenase-like flavoprotein